MLWRIDYRSALRQISMAGSFLIFVVVSWIIWPFLRLLADLCSIAWSLRPALIIVITFGVVTQLSGQLPELILGFREMPRPILAARFTALAIYVLCFFLIAYSFAFIRIMKANSEEPVWKRRLLISIIIAVIATVPAYSMLDALSSAEVLAVENGFDKEFRERFRYLQDYHAMHRIGTYAWIFLLTAIGWATLTEGESRIRSLWPQRIALFEMAPLFAIFSWIAVLIILGWQPVRLRAGGAIFFISLFFVLWTILFMTVFYHCRRHGVPGITIFLGWLTIVNWFDWNDHHFVSTLPSTPDAANASPKKIVDGFAEWISKRGDKAKTTYVLAAQGGGVYAAYHAAQVIAHLVGPQFDLRRDILAISAVSGGSVGSAIALTFVHELERGLDLSSGTALSCEDRWRTHEQLLKAIDLVFHRDYASTVVVGGAYMDTLLSLMPIRFIEKVLPDGFLQIDRAHFLERALVQGVEESLESATGKRPDSGHVSPLDLSMNRYRDEFNFAPYLVFNVVSAETGDRSFVAPSDFEFQQSRRTTYSRRLLQRSVMRALSGLDLSLIQAAVLSSRFPFVTPPASLYSNGEAGERRMARFVDGGYFDNSGVATAADIVDEFDRHTDEIDRAEDDPLINLIVLRNSRPIVRKPSGFNDIITPIQTMLLTRVARGEDYIDDAINAFRSENVFPISVAPPNINLTLGWFLSKNSLDQVKQHTLSEMLPLAEKLGAPCRNRQVAR